MKTGETYKSLYFLGIGGIGMSALAKYYVKRGVRVTGYDRTETALTKSLVSEGIQIHYTPDIKQIPADTDCVIYTPAIPADHPELVYIMSTGIRITKRAQAVAELANEHFCIAIAGTHGKTTITSLIAHIFNSSGKEILAFVGGIMKNYSSNLIFSSHPVYCIVEADEYDRSFLKLKPDIAVVSAVDADHLDIYGDYEQLRKSFEEFMNSVKPSGNLILQKQVTSEAGISHIKYGLDYSEGIHARNILYENGHYRFDIHNANTCLAKDVVFPFPGLHNVENALAATAVALSAGIPVSDTVKALTHFQGIHRRFDIRILKKNNAFIDDYAHHPREIDALIRGVREMYPSAEVTGIFQPHLYSRTRDFAEEFAHSLQNLDRIILTDIYPAREQPIPGITAQYLLGLINHPKKIFCSRDDISDLIRTMHIQVLLTIGAGDIDTLVAPLEEILTKRWEGMP